VSLAVSGVCGLAFSLIDYVAFYVVAPLWPPIPPGAFPWMVWSLALLAIWVNLACCTAYYAIASEAEARENTIKLLSAEKLAVDAANRMLRYQINPHFLFNTLNALATLVGDGDRTRAERVIFSLSNFLRHSLAHQPHEAIPLGEEIDVQRQYLGIEQIRFAERMRIVETVPDELRQARVPSLILQPLLENAVKHGVSASIQPVTIEISAAASGGQLHLAVTDDGRGCSSARPPNLGVGLNNVRERLSVLYGDRASMSAGPREGGGFEVRLSLPLTS
jgi:two-component system, LytTR family, sensor kinase